MAFLVWVVHCRAQKSAVNKKSLFDEPPRNTIVHGVGQVRMHLVRTGMHHRLVNGADAVNRTEFQSWEKVSLAIRVGSIGIRWVPAYAQCDRTSPASMN